MKEKLKKLVLIILLGMISFGLDAYPIDGYTISRIRRLMYLQLVMNGELKANLPIKGAQHSIEDINLKLSGSRGDSLLALPAVDLKLQKAIDQIFPNLDESYSITVLDITPGQTSALRLPSGKEAVSTRKCWKDAGSGSPVP